MIVDKVESGAGNEDNNNNNNNKANTIARERGKRKNEEVTCELQEFKKGSYHLLNESGGRKKDFSVHFKELTMVPTC